MGRRAVRSHRWYVPRTHSDRTFVMRKPLLILALGVVSTAALSAQTAAPAAATGKMDVQWKCAAPNPVNALPVPDKADHTFVVEQVQCTAAKGELAGVKQKEGAATEFAEATGNNSKGHGIFVETLVNGDKITYSYTFTGVSSNKVMDSGKNKWMATSGTGRFKGIKASGTCNAKAAADGTAVYDCVGTYTLPK
jgi:hypothetical protein